MQHNILLFTLQVMRYPHRKRNEFLCSVTESLKELQGLLNAKLSSEPTIHLQVHLQLLIGLVK
jgi:hypothetical protein